MIGIGPIWYFGTGWSAQLNHALMQDFERAKAMLATRAYLTLEPDTTATVLTSAAGTGWDRAVAAITADATTVLIYSPIARTVTIDLAEVTGTAVDVWEYRPSTGHSLYLGQFPSSGTKDFILGTEAVLVIDDAAQSRAAPGTAYTLALTVDEPDESEQFYCGQAKICSGTVTMTSTVKAYADAARTTLLFAATVTEIDWEYTWRPTYAQRTIDRMYLVAERGGFSVEVSRAVVVTQRTPAQILTDCSKWITADDATVVSGRESANVCRVSAEDYAQSDTAKRPYHNASHGGFNGRATMHANGGARGHSLHLYGEDAVYSSAHTIVLTGVLNESSPGASFCAPYGTANGNDMLLVGDGTTDLYMYSGTARPTYHQLVHGKPFIMMGVYNGASTEWYIQYSDGTTAQQTTFDDPGTTYSGVRHLLGAAGAYGFPGDICDFLEAQGDRSADRAALFAEWGAARHNWTQPN
jgi:hypothetical protein